MSRLEREVTGHFALYNHHLKTVLNTQWGLTEQPAWRWPLFSCLQERDIQDSKSQTLTWETAKKSLCFHRLPFHREERGAPGINIRPEATQNFSGQASVTHLTKGREEKLFLLKSLYFIID